MGLRRGPAVDRLASLFIDLTAEIGALSDGDLLGLRVLILGRIEALRAA